MGLLSRGMTFLARVGAVNESESVRYSQPGVFASKTVAAVIGGPGFGQEDNADIPGRVGDWAIDFIIRIADWETAGCVGEPKDGDLIVRSINRNGALRDTNFRVSSTNNVPAWDWGEPERITFRIHARCES